MPDDPIEEIQLVGFHSLLRMGNCPPKPGRIQGNQHTEGRQHPPLSSENTGNQDLNTLPSPSKEQRVYLCGNGRVEQESILGLSIPMVNSEKPVYCLFSVLLLSRFSCVRLCVTPEMAAHQAPPSLGFSRQEHWSGLPFPSPMHESESEKWKWSRSVVSNSSWPQGLQPTRLLRPWDFPGESTGVGCHCLLRFSVQSSHSVNKPLLPNIHILVSIS